MHWFIYAREHEPTPLNGEVSLRCQSCRYGECRTPDEVAPPNQQLVRTPRFHFPQPHYSDDSTTSPNRVSIVFRAFVWSSLAIGRASCPPTEPTSKSELGVKNGELVDGYKVGNVFMPLGGGGTYAETARIDWHIAIQIWSGSLTCMQAVWVSTRQAAMLLRRMHLHVGAALTTEISASAVRQ